jgi:hypothetical protein
MVRGMIRPAGYLLKMASPIKAPLINSDKTESRSDP